MLKRVLSQILTSSDHNLRIISKRGKRFAKKVDIKEIKFPVKIRDNHKIEKNNSIGTSVFCYENKEKYPICVSKNTFKRYVDY